MKNTVKVFGGVITVLIFLTVMVFVVNANTIGDIDGNGSVSAADARLALRYAAKLDTSFTDAQKEAADVNGDGAITAADARLILRAAAKLEVLTTKATTTTTSPTTTTTRPSTTTTTRPITTTTKPTTTQPETYTVIVTSDNQGDPNITWPN